MWYQTFHCPKLNLLLAFWKLLLALKHLSDSVAPCAIATFSINPFSEIVKDTYTVPCSLFTAATSGYVTLFVSQPCRFCAGADRVDSVVIGASQRCCSLLKFPDLKSGRLV
jgi:hypothetical protein